MKLVAKIRSDFGREFQNTEVMKELTVLKDLYRAVSDIHRQRWATELYKMGNIGPEPKMGIDWVVLYITQTPDGKNYEVELCTTDGDLVVGRAEMAPEVYQVDYDCVHYNWDLCFKE